jgi:hypothetical protein
MIDAKTLNDRLAQFLGSETDVEVDAGRIAVLTPAEYPNRDGVVVWVEPVEEGRYVVSDHGEADTTLVPRLSSRAIAAPAAVITRRFGVNFDGGQVSAIADDGSLPETCWRVAQAAAAIAEASTFQRVQPVREVEFADLLTVELRRRSLEVERERPLEGASGHEHKASLYVPATETVIEPIGGDRAWNVASAVYVEFGDLRSANGYKLLAVLDDRVGGVGEDVAGLLRQVGNVSRWSRHDEWIGAVGGASLL